MYFCVFGSFTKSNCLISTHAPKKAVELQTGAFLRCTFFQSDYSTRQQMGQVSFSVRSPPDVVRAVEARQTALTSLQRHSVEHLSALLISQHAFLSLIQI